MTMTSEAVRDALALLGNLDLESLQIIAAEQIAQQHYPHLDPSQPSLLIGVSDAYLAARVQQTLLQAYPPDHQVTLVGQGQAQSVPLSNLDKSTGLGPATCLWVPPLPGPGSYAALQDVIAHLRAPDGCPWDRALTWARLRATLLEETYELLAALDAENPHKVAEELGDLLLQVAMQTQIACEQGLFRLPDVIQRVVDKLIRRHPHVFGTAQVSGPEEVLANWEAIKAAERAQNGEKRSPLAGIPAGLPALAQAAAYLDRMSRLRPADVPQAPWSALAELPAHVPPTAELVGEVLFGLVAWAMAHGIEAESALRQANARFAERVAAEGWG